MWSNVAHLFSVSLIPFTTEWIAESRLAAAPVAMYAAVFVLVNITYVAVCREAVDRPKREDVTQRMRRLMHMRSVITIGVFGAATVIALWWPVAAMVLICLCLIGYLRPDVPAKDVPANPIDRPSQPSACGAHRSDSVVIAEELDAGLVAARQEQQQFRRRPCDPTLRTFSEGRERCPVGVAQRHRRGWATK